MLITYLYTTRLRDRWLDRPGDWGIGLVSSNPAIFRIQKLAIYKASKDECPTAESHTTGNSLAAVDRA